MVDAIVGKALWTAEDAADATRGRLIGSDSWIATGISIDTRTLEPGDLFVALAGARDGHDFVAEAFAKGAAAALVTRVGPGDGARLLVADTLQALNDLAMGARARSDAKRIAITGSVGKTSVKEALNLCLSAYGATHAAAKSYNNHIGVPLTLALTPRHARYGVFEVGMNHPGEIAPLGRLVRPHVAIITTIAPVHIEHMGSLEAIAGEKADLYDTLEPGGAALAPIDGPYGAYLSDRARAAGAALIRFGRTPGAEARLLAYDEDAEGAWAEAEILGRAVRYRVGAPGAPWATNALAALAAIAALGLDLGLGAAALARLTPPQGRGGARTIAGPNGPFTLVDDAYNASPASVAAAIETLSKRPGRRRLAALGDMLELGADESAYHAALAGPLEQAGVDLVFLAGPRMRALWDALPSSRRGGYAQDAHALAPIIERAVCAGDIVLVKGSNGSNMKLIVEALAGLERL